MSWRKQHGDFTMVSPRALKPGDLVISKMGGGFRGDWRLRYYLVKPGQAPAPQAEDRAS